MQLVAYRLNYSAKEDSITFSLRLGEEAIRLTLKTDEFFELCDSIVVSSKPFLEMVKRKRAEGIKEDAEFDTESWDRLMNTTEG